MDFQGYFEPSTCSKSFIADKKSGYLLENIHISTTEKPIVDLSGFDAVIIGITENRNSACKEISNLPELVRKKLYSFSSPGNKKKIADLGNLINGKKLEDTYIGLRDIIAFLLKENKIPIILGGSNHIGYACYLAYENIKRNVSITAISPRIQLLNAGDEYQESYLNKILNFKGDHLFNFSNLGYQSCMVNKQEIDLIEKLFFDASRLGTVRSNMRDTEPVMRDTDFLLFDISSLKQSDAPGSSQPSPNGFYSEEACQLSRYAGISDKLSCFGLFEVCPGNDIQGQTINLSAQIIWYFLEGLNQRRKEYPLNNPKNFTKYIVTLEGKGEDLVFYKSQESSRWWIEVPSTKYNSNVIMACTYDDYQKASNQELPDRWWRTYQKIN
jgi:formiminoglutamase